MILFWNYLYSNSILYKVTYLKHKIIIKSLYFHELIPKVCSNKLSKTNEYLILTHIFWTIDSNPRIIKLITIND